MKHKSKWGVEEEKGSAKIVANCSCGASLTYTGASLSPKAAVQDALHNVKLEHSDGTKESIPRDIWEKFREAKIDMTAY
jgi:hypothetical protein